MTKVKRILVPTDYSDCSRHALEYALRLAGPLGAAVDTVHVWSAPYFGPGFEDVPVGDSRQSLYTLIRLRASEEMARFLSGVEVPQSLTFTSHVESGEPCQTIIEVAEHRKVDLIVAGTHGRTGARYFLLGSVAARLVQLSTCPVLTVPPSDSPKEAR
jgi:nucleotide-binding universal stress UspA family protein